jgi:hypothetical protein
VLDGSVQTEAITKLLDQLPEDAGDRHEAQGENQRSHVGDGEEMDHGVRSLSQKKHIASALPETCATITSAAKSANVSTALR